MKTSWARGHQRLFALVDATDLLAGAARYDLAAVLDGQPVPVCGIGAVFTAPAHRGHGHADVLIERLIDAAAREGAGLALLFSSSSGAWSPHGFDAIPTTEVSIGVAPSSRPGAPMALIRSAEARDVAAIEAMGRVRADPFRFHLDREVDLIERAITRKRLLAGLGPPGARQLHFFIAEEGVTAAAYVVISIAGHVDTGGMRRPRGILSKAKRGELRGPLPIGLVYGVNDKVMLDPDLHVQHVIRLFFDTYRRTGSMLATVKEFHTQDLAFPRRVKRGPRLGELVGGELVHSRARQMIHNPRYAGAFFFGRTRTRTGPDGQKRVVRVPRDQWMLLPDIPAGYITWEEYEENLRRLQVNAQARGPDRRRSPPREGPALRQGLAICGHCGERMTVRYHCYHGTPVPDYWCGRRRINHGEPGICQTIHGGALDDAIGEILVEAMTPLALDVALRVQHELAARAVEADRVRQQHVDRARYDADLAQQRFLRVDPENRLVADAIDAEWKDRLRALAVAQETYEQARATDARVVTDEQRADILALATVVPRLWRDPATSAREKKRMMRLLIADVTLRKGKTIHADIRFTGGATRSVEIPLPKTCIELRTTDAAIVREIDRLLDTYTDAEIADLLNERGVRTATMQPFTRITVIRLRTAYGLTSRRTRLLKAGLLTPEDVARRYGLRLSIVHEWRRRGLLRAHPVNDKGEYLYEIPSHDLPTKFARKRAYHVPPRTPSRDARGAV